MEAFAPSSVERFGGAVLQDWQLMPRLSAMRRLSYLLLPDNFIQTAGIRDGASHCAKILSVFYDNLNTSDPNDPELIIKIDISNAFNTTCRAFTLDVLSGRASRDSACGLKGCYSYCSHFV